MQAVRIGNYVSYATNVLNGIPQVCVLAPWLFLVFVNDICYVAENYNVSVKLFANDIKRYVTITGVWWKHYNHV